MGTKTIETLNRISQMLGGASDYEVAQHLGVTRATVSKWRTGQGSMSDETALIAASFADQTTPEALLLEMAAERTTSEKAAETYRRIARRLRAAAAVVTLGIASFLGFFLHSPPVQAAARLVDNSILW